MISVSDINFRILAYEVNAGIYVCDGEGTFIYANLALADIFDVERPDELIGRNFKDFISPESLNTFMNQFRKSMISGSNSKLITTHITRKDGKTAYIEVNAMPFIKNRAILGNQGVVHDITKLKQAENKLMYTSTHDPLTGIFNRNFFEAELERLERGRQFPISIIVVNIEGLKQFSNSVDYEGGDKIIIRVARQLFYSFRGDDIVARIGENEFAVLIPNIDEKTIKVIIRRIQGDLQQINTDDNEPGLEFYIAASTAKMGESLNSALKKSEAIVNLKKKNADLNR